MEMDLKNTLIKIYAKVVNSPRFLVIGFVENDSVQRQVGASNQSAKLRLLNKTAKPNKISPLRMPSPQVLNRRGRNIKKPAKAGFELNIYVAVFSPAKAAILAEVVHQPALISTNLLTAIPEFEIAQPFQQQNQHHEYGSQLARSFQP